ncbi:MAG: type II toxin-antitoxin system RelE/ParE family toxin [Xanthobacteraceae bacterium]
MLWIVRFEDEFEQEFLALEQEVQDELLAVARLLAEHGPQLGRPYVDTLKGSKHTTMKELRFDAMRGVWRVAFAFDPRRQGILLVAGDKSGVSQHRFYKQLIATADKRFAAHLERLKKASVRRR